MAFFWVRRYADGSLEKRHGKETVIPSPQVLQYLEDHLDAPVLVPFRGSCEGCVHSREKGVYTVSIWNDPELGGKLLTFPLKDMRCSQLWIDAFNGLSDEDKVRYGLAPEEEEEPAIQIREGREAKKKNALRSQ